MTAEKNVRAETAGDGEQNARAWMESIREMVAALECDYDRLEELRDARDGFEIEDVDANAADDGPNYANDAEAWAGENPDDAAELAELEKAAGEFKSQDEARQRIEESVLSVEVRDGWHTPGLKNEGPVEYRILLTCGGPTLWLEGELNMHDAPDNAELQHSWCSSMARLPQDDGDEETLKTFARCFYFGE